MTISIKQFVETYTQMGGTGDYQCVALAKAYLSEVFGLYFGSIGHAYAYYNNSHLTPYFHVIPNNGVNKPRRGDLMVWNTSWGGGYGHIGIVLAYDDTGIWVLEQNGGSGFGNASPGNNDNIRIFKRGYSGVMGWMRYKNILNIVIQNHFDNTVYNHGLYIWEATNHLNRIDVAKKTFYYLAGYQHTFNGKNQTYIWNQERPNHATTYWELAHMIVNFYKKVKGRNMSYQDLIDWGVWNGSYPHNTVTGEAYTYMINNARNI